MANEHTVNLVLSELNLRKHTLTSITPLGIFLLKFFIIIYHYQINVQIFKLLEKLAFR